MVLNISQAKLSASALRTHVRVFIHDSSFTQTFEKSRLFFFLFLLLLPNGRKSVVLGGKLTAG